MSFITQDNYTANRGVCSIMYSHVNMHVIGFSVRTSYTRIKMSIIASYTEVDNNCSWYKITVL